MQWLLSEFFPPWQRFRHSRGELSGLVALWHVSSAVLQVCEVCAPCGGGENGRCFERNFRKVLFGQAQNKVPLRMKKILFLVYNCRILVTGPIMPLPKVFPAGSVIELCGAAVLRTSEDCNWAVFCTDFLPKRDATCTGLELRKVETSEFSHAEKGIFTDWKASQVTVDSYWLAKWWDIG